MTNIIPNRRYTFAEMEALRNDPDVKERFLTGYVLRQNLDGTVQFVHYSDAAAGGGIFQGTPARAQRFFSDPTPDFGELPAIRKRTPLERKISLVNRWWEDCKRTGTVPGLSDEKVSEIVGTEWKTGTTQMTGEIVERLAAAMLQDAERKAS